MDLSQDIKKSQKNLKSRKAPQKGIQKAQKSDPFPKKEEAR